MIHTIYWLEKATDNRVSFVCSFASVFTSIFSEKNMQKVVHPTEDRIKI